MRLEVWVRILTFNAGICEVEFRWMETVVCLCRWERGSSGNCWTQPWSVFWSLCSFGWWNWPSLSDWLNSICRSLDTSDWYNDYPAPEKLSHHALASQPGSPSTSYLRTPETSLHQNSQSSSCKYPWPDYLSHQWPPGQEYPPSVLSFPKCTIKDAPDKTGPLALT